jgi:hypothetical protein
MADYAGNPENSLYPRLDSISVGFATTSPTFVLRDKKRAEEAAKPLFSP